MHVIRTLFRILAIVLTLAIVVPVAAVYLFPDRIAAAVAARLERVTGVEVSFEGRLHPSVYPVLGLRTGYVAARSAAWTRENGSASATGIEVEVSPAALLRGELEITGVRLLDPVVRLDRSTLASLSERAGGGQVGGPAVRVRRVAISNGRILVSDAAKDRDLDFGGIHATIDMPSSNAPARIRGSLVRNGTGVQFDMTLDPAAAPAAAGPLRVVSSVRAGDAFAASYSGNLDVGNAAAEGSFTFSAPDLREALGFAGIAVPEDFPGRDLSVRGVLTAEPGAPIRLAAADVASGDVKLFGRIDLQVDDAIEVRAVFTAENVDLSQDLVWPPSGGRPDGWSSERILPPDLGAVDAVVSLDARSIDFGRIRTGRTRVGVVFRNGMLAVRLREAQAFGGTMSGRLDAALANSPSLSVDIAARAVRIEQLPVAAGGPDRATGTADADVRLRGTGDNLQGIISGLEGDGSVRLGDVRIPDAGEGFLETDINVASASASFTVTNGVAHNEDLAATGSNYIATGRGTIDIGARTVDYVLTPVIGSVPVPVEITGPWHNPAYRIDLQGIPGVEALLDEAVEDVLASLLEDGIEGLPDLAEGLDPGRLLGLQVDGPQDNAGETGSELERLREGLGGLLRGLTGE